MAETAENALYDDLMRMKPADLSPNGWAMKAGVSRAVWSDMRKNGNSSRRTIEKLLAAIDSTPAEFEALRLGPPKVRTEVAGTGMSVKDVENAWRMPGPSKPVPVLGSAIGGEYADIDSAVELTELDLTEVLDYVGRPPSLANDAQAYAVTIVGDSMAPRFEPGERAFVSPKGVPGIGDDVIVQLKACEPKGDDAHDERVTMVLIKRLVKRTAKFVELQQFNPDMTFQVPVTRIAHVHRVVGRL